MANPVSEARLETRGWLLEQWKHSFALALESMTGEKPVYAATADYSEPTAPEDGTLWWEQTLIPWPEPAAWIGISDAVRQELGGRVLRAAGIGETGPEEARTTFLEVLSQALSGWAGILGAAAGRDVSCGAGAFVDAPPEEAALHTVGLTLPDGREIRVTAGFSRSLVESTASPPGGQADPSPAEEGETAAGSAPYKTFDLLLDVELPVSVSFGRTKLALQDVLKLTAGSIVELNRSINDPVELIVNNCVVALGEVVVIEGNYGVRILRIASREKRLWSTGHGWEGDGTRHAP